MAFWRCWCGVPELHRSRWKGWPAICSPHLTAVFPAPRSNWKYERSTPSSLTSYSGRLNFLLSASRGHVEAVGLEPYRRTAWKISIQIKTPSRLQLIFASQNRNQFSFDISAKQALRASLYSFRAISFFSSSVFIFFIPPWYFLFSICVLRLL